MEVYWNFEDPAAVVVVAVVVVVAAAAVGGVCDSAAAVGWTGGLVGGPTWGVELWEDGVASFDFVEQIGYSWRTKTHKQKLAPRRLQR